MFDILDVFQYLVDKFVKRPKFIRYFLLGLIAVLSVIGAIFQIALYFS